MDFKIIFYIDGLNLYQGLKEANLQDFYWLDIAKLVYFLKKENQQLVKIKYFTSMFSENNECKLHWQTIYLKALSTFDNLEIIKGRHQLIPAPVECDGCRYTYNKYEEKLTDVNIACEMIDDVYHQNCDTIALVSADSDLKPMVDKIFKLFPHIKIFAMFPPERYSEDLKNSCSACRVIPRTSIRDCKLPDYVTNKSGTKIYNPKIYDEIYRRENPISF